MRVYKLKAFARFQRRERIADKVLAKAVRVAEDGLVDADLGGGLIKQRVARSGQGKSGGYRTVIAYRRGDRAVFLFGFAKNERANLDDDDGIEATLVADELTEVSHGDEG
ncbi:MAG: type II toxin-antitoxin system RelE/ParE family toxin [Alphaproteobacteria bacterium]|nr:type II toxin-antitoxin system RelE/ParE family toxin [Alphaproteobacteria bacterium]